MRSTGTATGASEGGTGWHVIANTASALHNRGPR